MEEANAAQLDAYKYRTGRDLRTALLSPNVVRIELLDGIKVLRYLGTLQRFGYENVRTPLMQSTFKDNADETVFYGILKGGVDHSWEMGANWTPNQGGGLLGMMKTLVGKIPLVGSTLKVAESAVKLGERVTGTNTTATGSSTMKQYMGATLKSPTITVSWYLPEQYALCLRGLQTLSRMAYARELNETDFKRILSEKSEEIVKAGVDKLVSSTTGAPPDAGGGDLSDVIPNLTADLVSGGLSWAIGKGVDATFAANSFFGKNLTFDPIPLRLCVGQFMDVEPLVITNLKITFSKEQFVSNAKLNNIPLHLPLFCTAEIAFDFWLNPSPSLQFMNFLGVEMFGPQTGENTIAKLAASEINEKSKQYDVRE